MTEKDYKKRQVTTVPEGFASFNPLIVLQEKNLLKV